MVTNKVLEQKFPRFSYRDYLIKKENQDLIFGSDIDEFLEEDKYQAAATVQNNGFTQSLQGIFAGKGCELGRFNMGSTVVMLFEAEDGFKFLVKEGQKVKYGDIVGQHKNSGAGQ